MQNNLEKYIGKTFKVFKFENGKHNEIEYNEYIDNYVDCPLIIQSYIEINNSFAASNGWWYPAELVIAQIEANEAQCDKDFRAAQNAPQIVFNRANINKKPTFEVGELIHVWDDEEEKKENFQEIFLFEKDGLFATVASGYELEFKENKSFEVIFWQHAQKIPTKPKMTKQEFKEKFGVEFDNLIVE
jgi:hypothetical protein